VSFVNGGWRRGAKSGLALPCLADDAPAVFFFHLLFGGWFEIRIILVGLSRGWLAWRLVEFLHVTRRRWTIR